MELWASGFNQETRWTCAWLGNKLLLLKPFHCALDVCMYIVTDRRVSSCQRAIRKDEYESDYILFSAGDTRYSCIHRSIFPGGAYLQKTWTTRWPKLIIIIKCPSNLSATYRNKFISTPFLVPSYPQATLGARGFLREEPWSVISEAVKREKIDKRWENLWLPTTADRSYCTNRFELGSRSDPAS